MTTEKNYKFSVLEASLRYPDEIVKYIEEDEDVQGMKCFEKFADAKEFAKECLEEKYKIIHNMKAKDVK